MELITGWFKRQMENPEVVLLVLLLGVGCLFILFFADILSPFLASVIIAYLLQGGVAWMRRRGLPKAVAIGIMYGLFIACLLVLMLVVVPMIVLQLGQLADNIPDIIGTAHGLLIRLPEHYPALFAEEQINDLLASLRGYLVGLSEVVLTRSMATAMEAMTLFVYLILVCLMVFFLLKDEDKLIAWFKDFLPENRALSREVWADVNAQLWNYISGKFAEIAIVGTVTFVTFSIIGLPYAALLAAITGVSVLIPYVGAAVVTAPVAAVAYLTWGLDAGFYQAIIAYGIIQALDGNLLVPLLFSEAIDIHPVAIIVAILFFGGLWGLWGVFFAIPLAVLVKSVIKAWPRANRVADAEI